MKRFKFISLLLVLFSVAFISCNSTEGDLEGFWQLHKIVYETGVEEGEFGDEKLELDGNGHYRYDQLTEGQREQTEGKWNLITEKDSSGTIEVIQLTPKEGKPRKLRILELKNKNLIVEENSIEGAVDYRVKKYFVMTEKN